MRGGPKQARPPPRHPAGGLAAARAPMPDAAGRHCRPRGEQPPQERQSPAEGLGSAGPSSAPTRRGWQGSADGRARGAEAAPCRPPGCGPLTADRRASSSLPLPGRRAKCRAGRPPPLPAKAAPAAGSAHSRKGRGGLLAVWRTCTQDRYTLRPLRNRAAAVRRRLRKPDAAARKVGQRVVHTGRRGR